MKKFVAAFAALAVAGAVGVMYVNEKIDADTAAEQSTTTTSSYAQSDDSYTQSGVAVNGDKTRTTAATTAETTYQKSEVVLKAGIDEVSGNTLVLSVDESSDAYDSAHKIHVSFKNVEVVDTDGRNIKADDVANFKNATVYYDGLIMETYPVQVKASKIVLRNRTDCNVYFCLPDGKVIDVVHVPVGSHLDSADMPNAGAYCDDGYHFEGWNLNGEKVFGIDNVKTSISLIAEIRKD